MGSVGVNLRLINFLGGERLENFRFGDRGIILQWRSEIEVGTFSKFNDIYFR
jgi:hypothetical protein